jgi:hypothetical protein
MTDTQPRDKTIDRAAIGMGIVMLVIVLLLATGVVPPALMGWALGTAAVCLFGVLGIGVLTLRGALRVAVIIVVALIALLCVLTLLGPAIGRSSSGS